jgi:hypothetical protein
MADGITFQSATPATPSAGVVAATDDAGASGHVQIIKLAISTDGSATVIPADATNGLDVDVTRLPALPAGTNNIGDVDVLTLPALPAGTNNIGDVDVLTLPALPAGTNNIGDVDVLSIAAGDNNIGNVDIVSLPAIPAGTNNIGDVDVLTLPALPAGTNNIGDVDIVTMPSTVVEDTASAGGETSILIAGVRNDAAAAKTSLDGDFGNIAIDSAGRVGIADLGGAISVDDNGSSLTVDAPVGTPVNVQIGDGTRTATVRDTGTSDSLNVSIVDASGNQITSFGGGTQYAEDTAHASGDQVTMAGVVQQAADVALSTDGDRSLLQVDANGFLKVNIKAGAGSGGTAQADESSFVEGTTNMTPIGGVLNDTITSDPTEDQAAAVRITAKRSLHVNLRNVAGNEMGTVTNPIQVEQSLNIVHNPNVVATSVALNAVNAAVTVSAEDNDSIHFEIDTGTLVGTVVAEATLDDTNWFSINTIQLDGTIASSFTVFGIRGTFVTGGWSQVRLRVSAYTSGSSNARLEGADATSIVRLGQAIPAGTNNIGDVDVLTLPALPAGTNNIGDVDVLTLPSIPAGTNNIGDVDVLTLPALPAGTNNIGDVDIVTLPTVTVGNAGASSVAKAEDAASADLDVGIPAMAVRKATPANTSGTDGDYEMLQMSAGRLWTSTTIDAAIPAGTNNIGDVDVLTLPALPAGTNNIGDVDVLSLPAIPAGSNLIGQINPQPTTSGGLLIFRSLDLDETEEDVKTSAGQVYGWFITNRATTPRYIKFYNATAANVTVGTTTPVMTLEIPGNSTDHIAANALGTMGIEFSTAICVAATTGFADADTGAPAANDVIINVFYK